MNAENHRLNAVNGYLKYSGGGLLSFFAQSHGQ